MRNPRWPSLGLGKQTTLLERCPVSDSRRASIPDGFKYSQTLPDTGACLAAQYTSARYMMGYKRALRSLGTHSRARVATFSETTPESGIVAAFLRIRLPLRSLQSQKRTWKES
jgi:hypothetical protein